MLTINNRMVEIFYQNVRGLRYKTTEFRLNILGSNWEIVALTETWLNDSISSSELFPPMYNVYRRDRCEARTGRSRGGGVLIAVIDKIKVSVLHNLNSDLEDLWLKLEFPNKKIVIVSVVYFPPNSPLAAYNNYFSKFDLLDIKNEKIIIMGDFNLPVTGINYNLGAGNEICKQMLFFNEMCNVSLRNNVLNESGKTLDLVLADSDCTVTEECCPPVNVDKHHPPLL